MKAESSVAKSKKRNRRIRRKQYEITNILPLSLLGSQGLNDSKESLHEIRAVDDQGNIIYDKIKYNLSELFDQTPAFDEAPVRI